MRTEADITREIVTDWLGMFDPPPQIDFQQSEMLQAGIAHALKTLRAERDAAARDMRERCAKVAEGKAQEFLSPEYARHQPLSSAAERFACGEVATAIRALETAGPAGTVIATKGGS